MGAAAWLPNHDYCRFFSVWLRISNGRLRSGTLKTQQPRQTEAGKNKWDILLYSWFSIRYNLAMPRTSRASQGGYVYHVLNRGNDRGDVFHKAEDYLAFVNLMRESNERLPMRLVGYCLLTNHFHMMLWPFEDGDLSRWMQWLDSRRQQRGNRSRTGVASEKCRMRNSVWRATMARADGNPTRT